MICGGVGSRHSSQAGSEGRREKDEKLTLHVTPNSFMSTSLVKSPTLDTEHGKPHASVRHLWDSYDRHNVTKKVAAAPCSETA